MGEGWDNDPKRQAVIRIALPYWPTAAIALPCQAPRTGSSLVCTSGATRPCTELPPLLATPILRRKSRRVLMTGRGSCWSHVPIQGTSDEMRLMLLTCLACPCIMRSEWLGPCSTPLFGGELYRCGGARRHGMIFPVCGRCWWSRWLVFGERRLSKVRCRCKLARRFE